MVGVSILTTIEQVQAYANNLGVPREAVCDFVNSYGHYPTSPDELSSFGNAKGYRNQDGSWNWTWWQDRHTTCTLSMTAPGGNNGGGLVTGTGGIDRYIAQAKTWAQANPVPAVIIGVLGLSFLFGSKRR